MNGAKTAGNNRTPRATNGGGGRGQQVEGVASVLIIFEIDGPADIKQTNKFPTTSTSSKCCILFCEEAGCLQYILLCSRQLIAQLADALSVVDF